MRVLLIHAIALYGSCAAGISVAYASGTTPSRMKRTLATILAGSLALGASAKAASLTAPRDHVSRAAIIADQPDEIFKDGFEVPPPKVLGFDFASNTDCTGYNCAFGYSTGNPSPSVSTDGVLDIVDANGDGVLDDIINFACGEVYEMDLVTDKPLNGIGLDGAPTGMTVTAQGRITYQPHCSNFGETDIVIYTFNSNNTYNTMGWRVNNVIPRFVGLDTDNDPSNGITWPDANMDTLVDGVPQPICGQTSQYQLALNVTGEFDYSVSSSPPEMSVLAGTDTVSFTPTCPGGSFYTVQFNVSNTAVESPPMYASFFIRDPQ